MGLDSVYLVMAIEEEFGISIPHQDAEKIVTVGDLYDWLRERISISDPVACFTQRAFYKLRRALVQNYGIERSRIAPDVRLTDLLPLQTIEEGWPFIDLHLDVKMPPFKVANQMFGMRFSEESLTMRELVDGMIEVNGYFLQPQRETEDQIWKRLVQVFVRQQNLPEAKITPQARITRDLGID